MSRKLQAKTEYGWSSESEEEDVFQNSRYNKTTASQSTLSSKDGDGNVGYEGMDSVIQIMNQLYDIGHQINAGGHKNVKIKLPQIVVCGSQSSGKSSVLESISGEEFLPRGLDIQTKCPIVLQLVHTKDTQKYVEFLHAKGKKFTDMDEVRNEIEKTNMRIVASKRIVTDEPITLKLFSPTVTNLTLVDLPGLVENSTEGQPPDLVDKINELVYQYISNENCIILAISPATIDVADSKSIRLAKKVDPKGIRTLGVLTKLDLMDEGTNANDVLMGRKIKLELGIVGVVNRSYRDVEDGKRFRDQLRKEKLFLEQNYPHIAVTNGTPYLIQKISQLLMKTIQRTLPGIKDSIERLIETQQQQLEEIGEPEVMDDNKGALLLHLLTKFVESYCAQVDGRRRNLETNTLSASARIKQLFDQKLGEEFEKLVASNKVTDKEIDNLILNSHALHSRHIDFDDAFQELAKQEIKKLAPYVTQCTKEVCKEMRLAIDTSCDPIIQDKYPRLYQKIKKTALQLISERFKDCQRYLDDYVNAEASIARTIKGGFRDKVAMYEEKPIVDDDADSGRGSNSSKGSEHSFQHKVENLSVWGSKKKKTPKPSKSSFYESRDETVEPTIRNEDISFENSHSHRANVKRDVRNYFDNAKGQIMEHVAKGIVYKLVYGTSNKMTEYMLYHLHSTENAETLMINDKDDVVKESRAQIEKLMYEYEHANNVVDMILSKIDNMS